MVDRDYIDVMVASFIEDIKHIKVKSSYKISIEACKLLTSLVKEASWTSPNELRELVRELLDVIKIHLPKEVSIFNVFYKFLKLCRDEIDRLKKGENDGNAKMDIKDCLLEVIDEMKTEIETSMDNITNLSTEILHPNQRVLTIGQSNTLQMFFKKASKKFPFELFIMENSPKLDGHEMASQLSSSRLHTTIIADASCFSIMSRMHAVVISATTITADGGIKCLSGCYNIALAAKHYNVPVYVCAPMFKFSPHHFGFIQQDSSNTFLSNESVMVTKEGHCHYHPSITTHLPVFDFVPPSLISLILTNLGGNEPSQMYRFLNELYIYEECVCC